MNYLHKVWVLAAFGALFFWLALPPMHQPWAALVACALWAQIVSQSQPLTARDYWLAWLVGSGLWLTLLQGVRLANPMLYPGWIALGLYLGVYLPLFLGLARSLVSSLAIPYPIAMGIAWVGCECLRSYFATGFSAGMLAHSQTPFPCLLSIAAHLGAYGVSFLVMVSGSLLHLLCTYAYRSRLDQPNSPTVSTWSVLSITLLSIALWSWSIASYYWHEADIQKQLPAPVARFLIVQEDMPTTWDIGRDELQLGWERYELRTELASKAIAEPPIDVVLWPESTFGGGIPYVIWDRKPFERADWGMTASDFETTHLRLLESFENKRARLLKALTPHRPWLLVGSDVWKIHDGTLATSNAALWFQLQPDTPVAHYAKQHLVMFGEYIPLLCWFPSWNTALGMPLVDAGTDATSFRLENGNSISTTICFEDVVPQLVRSNLMRQIRNGESPDVLVNLTNDAWFRGSSILDHHLNNAILAAVENRRPMLVAANQGISAWIDSQGRVIKSIPRSEAGSILAEPLPDGRWGLWQSLGDWPARLSLLLSFVPTLRLGLSRWIRKRGPQQKTY
jgi:apolipoprotein N-acyltransferase